MTRFKPPRPTPWVFDANRDPPVYTRPMVGSELVMQRHWNASEADGEVCIGVDFSSSLGIDELKSHAREALDKLRFVCPIIACAVEDIESPRWVYTPSADREAWLELAFSIEERGTSLNSSEFIQSINFKRLPYADGKGTTSLLRAYLLTTSNEGKDGKNAYGLYFHSSHAIIDAGPALHALNLMCEWISGEGMDVRIEQAEEWKNLPVDPVTATGGPCMAWETDGARLLDEFAEQNAQSMPLGTLAPPSRPLVASEPPFRYSFVVSESETGEIVAEAKKLGISVSALFHAAHCLAQIKMNPALEGMEVDFPSDSTTVSLERYLRWPVNPKTHLISCFTVIPLRFSMAQALNEPDEKRRLIMTSKILQERFDRYLANTCLPHLVASTAGMSPAGAQQLKDGNTEATETPISWQCAFNNLGIVERKLRTQHGRLTIESMCLGVRLRNFMTVHMWTMHSKLYFQVQGATAWGEQCIRTLLEETRRIGLLVLQDKS